MIMCSDCGHGMSRVNHLTFPLRSVECFQHDFSVSTTTYISVLLSAGFRMFPAKNLACWYGISGPGTPSTSQVPSLPCASNEDLAKLNYEDVSLGLSELQMWVILSDGSSLNTDVSKAVLGSGTFLKLPSAGTDFSPVRLLLRRSLTSSSMLFRLASVSVAVRLSRRIVVDVYDTAGQLADEHAVRRTCFAISISIASC